MAHTDKFTQALNHTLDRTTHPPTNTHSPATILNLSKTFIPTPSQTSLLERGLTFIPRPGRDDGEELRRDIHHFHRRLRLLDYFHYTHTDSYTPFRPPSTWQPKHSAIHPQISRLINRNMHTFNTFTHHHVNTHNLTPQEQTALQQLKRNKHIVIKPADKGSKIVIMDTQHYILECNRQLTNTQHYIHINNNIQKQTQTQLRQILDDLHRLNHITNRQTILVRT